MLKHRLKRDERSARGFGGLRSRTLSPFPTTRDMSDIPPKRTPSSYPYPYGGGEYIPWLTLSILLRCGIAKSGEVVYHILRM